MSMPSPVAPGGASAPRGRVDLQVVRGTGGAEARKIARLDGAAPKVLPTMRNLLHFGFPNDDDPEIVKAWKLRNAPNLMRGLRGIGASKVANHLLGVPTFFGTLWATVMYGDGTELPLGLISGRVVTTAGVGFIVDAFQNSVEVENMKYHALGTGTGAEASSDTALGTELTTEYVSNVRATGTTTEGASANIYRTVGAVVLDSGTPAVTEHGVFSASSAGVLLDRSKFSAVNLDGSAGDGLTVTYELTVVAGS